MAKYKHGKGDNIFIVIWLIHRAEQRNSMYNETVPYIYCMICRKNIEFLDQTKNFESPAKRQMRVNI